MKKTVTAEQATHIVRNILFQRRIPNSPTQKNVLTAYKAYQLVREMSPTSSREECRLAVEDIIPELFADHWLTKSTISL